MKLPDKINTIVLTSGILSFSSSLMMAIMIPKSTGGLSTPYRRIIFGLSISDIIQSLALVLGPFLLPSRGYSSGSSWAIGNVHTCDFQGFIFTFGATTTCMYTLFLCVYYYCKLKRNISDSTFKKKIETKMHCFIVLFNLVVCLIALATKAFNPLPGIGSCQLTRKPYRCDPSVSGSCERGHSARSFALFYFPVGIPFICLIGTLVFMFSIVVHVVKRDRLFRHRARQGNGSGDQGSEADSVVRLLRREVTLQVVLYVLAFLLTYGLTTVHSCLSRADIRTPIFVITIISASFPLMGLFNILIYTRPQIVAHRRLHRDVSWPVAFWRVLKAGGENPDSVQLSSQSRSTACCHGQFCCRWFKSYGQEDESKVSSGMLRLRALREYRASIPSFLSSQTGTKEPCFTGLEHGTEEGGWNKLDSTTVNETEITRSGTVKNTDIYQVENRHATGNRTFLSSQKDAISKAFEKASQRVNAMNAVDFIDKKEVTGVISYSERSVNRMNSDWSHGASPGSSSGSFADIELDNYLATTEDDNNLSTQDMDNETMGKDDCLVVHGEEKSQWG